MNGPPSFFLTFSCAEYYWPDLICLVDAREEMFSDRKDVYSVDKYGLVKAICEHTRIVQESFQIRVRKWLKIVDSGVFGIKYYWVRYNYAPSRGQIHAHL